jgi:hypothetical protein
VRLATAPFAQGTEPPYPVGTLGYFSTMIGVVMNPTAQAAAVTGLEKRLECLHAMLLSVDSPGQLSECLAEGGNLYAQLMSLKLVPSNDLLQSYAYQARENSGIGRDNSLSDFVFASLFVMAADAFSDRQRTLLRDVPNTTEMHIRKAVWPAGQTEPVVTLEPIGVRLQVTDWRRDYATQAPRYAGFVAELSATLQHRSEPNAEKDVSSLSSAQRSAYLAAAYAEAKEGRQLTDREAWEYLKENGIEGTEGLDNYELPMVDTFADYMTQARRLLGEKRKTPRGGRNKRSVIRRSDSD